MAALTELQTWQQNATQFLQQINQSGRANTVLRTILQNHNRVNSAAYLPTKSIEGRLRNDEPSQSVYILRSILDELIDDIDACSSNLGPWDSHTAKDAMELLAFQIDIQLSIVKGCLVEACNKFEKLNVQPQSAYGTDVFLSFAEMREELESKWLYVSIEAANFAEKIHWQRPSSEWEPGTVPATSFRELIVRNELNKRRDQIFEAIEIAQRSNTFPEASLLTETMQDVATRLLTAERYSKEDQFPDSWTPATIAIVADTKNKVIITGGTKPANINTKQPDSSSLKKKTGSPAIMFLKDAGTEICRARLGPRFYYAINQCSRQFSEKAQEKDEHGEYVVNTEGKNDEEINSLYDHAINWLKCDEHSQIQQSSVYSWAFCGYTLKLKPPCIRCTYLYSSWSLAARPDTAKMKGKELAGLRGHQMIYHDQRTPPCGYCAETVAAAQIFALDNGPMVYSG